MTAPMIVQYDNENNIVHANPAALEYTGRSLEDARGLSCAEFWGTDTADGSQNRHRELLQTERAYESQAVQLRADSGWWRLSLSKLFGVDGERIGLIAHYTPIETPDLQQESYGKRFSTAIAHSKISVWEYALQEDHFYLFMPKTDGSDEGMLHFDGLHLIGNKIELIHPDEQQQVLLAVEQLKNGKEEIELTFRIMDGEKETYRHIHLQGHLTEWDQSGKPLTAQGTITNLDEFHYLKEEQMKGVILYDHLFRQSPVFVVITAIKNGTVIDANEAFLSFSGFDRKDVIGKHIFDLGFWPQKAFWDELVQSFRDQHVLRDIQIPVLDRNGNQRRAIISVANVHWNGEPCGLTIGLDITEEFHLQQQVLQAQQRIQTALEAINEGFFELDFNHSTVLANDNYVKMLGYQPGEIEFSFTQWAYSIHRADRRKMIECFRDTLQRKINEATHRIRMRKKDGTEIWVLHYHKVAERDAEGLPRRVVGTITDLSEQIKIEQELQYQKETLEATLNAIDEGVWELDLRNRLMILNKRSQEILEFEKQVVKVDDLIHTLAYYIHPDDHQKLRQGFIQHFEGKYPSINVELRLLSQGITKKWFNLRGATNEFDAEGNPVRLVGTLADISERREMERLMRLAQAGVEQTAIMAFLFDETGTIVFVNDQACQKLDYTREELHQLRFNDLNANQDANRSQINAWKMPQEGGVAETSQDVEVSFLRKNQSLLPTRVNFRTVEFEDEHLFWAFAMDTTEIKAMENSLRQERESLASRVEERTQDLAAANQFLDFILQAIPMPIYIKDQELRYVDVNEAFTNYFGYKRNKMVGKTVVEFSSKERAARVMADDLAILNTEARVVTQEVLLNKDGERRETIIMRQGYKNPRTGEYGLIGAFLDIHDREMLGKQLQQANEELQNALHVKDEFLANMSHELRTPLTSIIGYSELLLAGMGGKLNKNQEKYIDHIHSAGAHLLSLINDILDYSKFNVEVSTLNMEVVRVRSICIAVLSIMEPRAFKKDIKMEFDFDEDVTDLYCDPQRLRQVLINLMNNAIKFSENYGTIGLRVKQIALPLPQVEFQIWDQGIGIDPEDQQRIFDPFTQVASELHRDYDGSGIGLALVKKFVELHHGTIRVESEPGVGSTFIVQIPMTEVDNP